MRAMIEIAPGLYLDETQLEYEPLRASGPGGQHVNKVSTAIQLRFDVAGVAGVAGAGGWPQEVRQRLQLLAGRRMTQQGVIVIEAREYRSQQRNRQAALERLLDLLRRAARPPRTRRKTRPTQASRRKRLEQKRQKSLKKDRRKPPGIDQ